MSAFTGRTRTYKAGVVLLIFTYVVFIAGYGSPFWSKAELDFNSVFEYTFHDGLWQMCTFSDSDHTSNTGCKYYHMDGFPAWFHVVRAMEGLSAAGLLFSVIYMFVTNCCRTFPGPRTRILEICALLSGLLSFAGCMIYLSMRNGDTDEGTQDLSERLTLFKHLDWAFYLAAISSGMCVIAAIVIAVGNKPVQAPPATGGMVMTTVTAQPGYAPQPYPASGEPYPGVVVQPGHSPNKAGYPAVQ